MKTRIILAAIFVMVYAAFGDDTNPDKPADPNADMVLLAVKLHREAIKSAYDAYQEAVTTANQKFIDDLTICLRRATKEGNTDQIKRINDLINATRAKMTAGVNVPRDSAESSPFAKPDSDAPDKPVAVTTDAILRDRICKQRHFDYIWEALKDQRVLELLPDGTIGQGKQAWEQRWDCAIVKGTPTLTITGEHGPVTLTLGSDGGFHGVWPGSTAVIIRATK